MPQAPSPNQDRKNKKPLPMTTPNQPKKPVRHKKAFWHNIRVKYKITIVNENTLEEVAGLRVSKLNGMSVLVCVLTILFAVAALIITFTPLRNYLPGYMNSEVRAQIVDNALRLDSMQSVLDEQNLYIMNIQDIFRGTVRADTIQSIDSLTLLRHDTLMERTRRETSFRQQYEEAEKYNVMNIGIHTAVEGMRFYRPLSGLIVTTFDPAQQHWGIDITATPGESIVATLDGTVLLSAYTAQHGYVVCIQHNQDLVSVYRNCGTLLKQEGTAVKAGEAIALTKAGEQNTHAGSLHFELWHRGRAINPELCIAF